MQGSLPVNGPSAADTRALVEASQTLEALKRKVEEQLADLQNQEELLLRWLRSEKFKEQRAQQRHAAEQARKQNWERRRKGTSQHEETKQNDVASESTRREETAGAAESLETLLSRPTEGLTDLLDAMSHIEPLHGGIAQVDGMTSTLLDLDTGLTPAQGSGAAAGASPRNAQNQSIFQEPVTGSAAETQAAPREVIDLEEGHGEKGPGNRRETPQDATQASILQLRDALLAELGSDFLEPPPGLTTEDGKEGAVPSFLEEDDDYDSP